MDTAIIQILKPNVTRDDAVRKLLSDLRAGKTVDAALVSASGADLKGWDQKWRAEITSVGGR